MVMTELSCDVDSMDLGLLVSVHFKVRDRNTVSNKNQHSFEPPFPVQPEGLVTSDGKSVVGVIYYSRSLSRTFLF